MLLIHNVHSSLHVFMLAINGQSISHCHKRESPLAVLHVLCHSLVGHNDKSVVNGLESSFAEVSIVHMQRLK